MPVSPPWCNAKDRKVSQAREEPGLESTYLLLQGLLQKAIPQVGAIGWPPRDGSHSRIQSGGGRCGFEKVGRISVW